MNFFLKGKIPLWKIFWIITFPMLIISYSIATKLIYLWDTKDIGIGILLFYTAIHIIILIFTTIAIWNSLKYYKGSFINKILVKFITIIQFVIMFIVWFGIIIFMDFHVV